MPTPLDIKIAELKQKASSRVKPSFEAMMREMAEWTYHTLHTEEATESDGWNMPECCPGDDMASGYNKCREDMQENALSAGIIKE